MRKVITLFTICLSLALVEEYAVGGTSGTMDAKKLLNLAPRISMEEKTISSFEVNGTLNVDGVQLRFIMLGKLPDQFALKILDPHDGTPIMVNICDSFMLYDPISSEVLLGRGTAIFVLRVEKHPEDVNKSNPNGTSLIIGFGLRPVEDKKKNGDKEDEPETSVIDIYSLLNSRRVPVEIRTKDNKSFELSLCSKKGKKVKAFVTPSRKEGPYTKVELYQSGKEKPFVVLDEIVLNQPLPATYFVFPRKKLLTSGLPIKQVSTDRVLSLVRILRTIMVRLWLAGSSDWKFKWVAEKMSMRAPDWEKVKNDDKKAGAVLRNIFQDDLIRPTTEEKGTIQRKSSYDRK